VCRVRGCPVLMVLREAPPHEAAESDAPRVMRCRHVGPSIVPEGMVLGVLDGGQFGEVEREFVICLIATAAGCFPLLVSDCRTLGSFGSSSPADGRR
jgi:hypothetical protein